MENEKENQAKVSEQRNEGLMENQAMVGARNEVNLGERSASGSNYSRGGLTESLAKNPTDLHREFVKLSFDIIKMKNKLMSLLLGIYEKEIYKEKGCRTIYEYGFRYAKLSKETINKALRTLKNVKDKPFLKQMIETQGIHKVSLVATLATTETDKLFAQHVENMSKPALFEFAKELRQRREGIGVNVVGAGRNVDDDGSGAFGGLFGTDDSNLFGEPKKCQAAPAKMSIELDSEMQTIFFQLKHEYARNCSNKEALKIILEKLKTSDSHFTDQNSHVKAGQAVPGNGIGEDDGYDGTREDKKKIDIKATKKTVKNQKISSADTTNRTPKTSKKSDAVLPRTDDGLLSSDGSNSTDLDAATLPSHNVPAKTKRQMLTKYQHKCAYPKCTRAAENIHHRVPFAFGRSHETIIPLCKIHHEFAHNGIIRHEHSEPENWKLAVEGKKNIYDGFRLKYRDG